MIKYGSIGLLADSTVQGCTLYPIGEWLPSYITEIYKKHALTPTQTHSLNVAIAEGWDESFPDTDALITFKRDLPIGVVTADCVPILIYAPDVEGVAAVHAGWKGSLGGIVDRVVDLMADHGAEIGKMKVAFGPSISKENYEVDETLADKFREAGYKDCISYPNGSSSRPHLDLQGVNISRLLSKGVKPENISPSDKCTYSSVDAEKAPLQSYRRDGVAAGRNLTMICNLSSEDALIHSNLI